MHSPVDALLGPAGTAKRFAFPEMVVMALCCRLFGLDPSIAIEEDGTEMTGRAAVTIM